MKNFIIRTTNNEMTGKDAAAVGVLTIILVVAAGCLLHALGFKLNYN